MTRKAFVPEKKDVTRQTDDVLAENIHKRDRKVNTDMQEDMLYGKKAYKRTEKDTIQERDSRYARLHDLKNHKRVEMFWDFNDAVTRDQVFKLKVGAEEVYLSSVEMMKFIRWV